VAQTKKRRHGKKRSADRQMTWILAGLAGGVMLVIAALALVSRQNDKPGERQFDPNFRPEVTGAPRVEVLPQDAIDYGDVKLGTTITTEFHVRNVGDQQLVVLGEPQVEVMEGC